MKRHIQKTGVRKFFGQDFIDLQTEPLAVLDGFFAEYGACVIEGCAITEADGGTFDIASGLVAIEATDPESGAVSIRTMPFEGVEGVALPLYLSAEWVVVERAYGDGKVKPIAYNLRAVASGIKPSKAYLMLTAAGGNRFVDVVQDGTHRFVSDSERTKWNDILRQAKEYAVLQTEAAKRSAIEHTDAVAAAVRDELVGGDAATLVGAKQYADRIVAALVDSSPEALNTLQELAAALGGDPNFATTVMNEIGKRVTTDDMNAALASKLDKSGGILTGELGINPSGSISTAAISISTVSNTTPHATYGVTGEGKAAYIRIGASDSPTGLTYHPDGVYNEYKTILHSGNFDPANKADRNTVYDSGQLGLNVDFNTILTPGTYQIETNNFPDTSSNAPVINDYGTLTVVKGISFTMQIYYSRMINKPYFRCGYNNASWDNWSTYTNTLATTAVNGLMAAADKTKLSAMPAKIIRGSVTADGGNGGGNAGGTWLVYGEGAVVRITHNLGTYSYSATATSVSNTNIEHSDNVVSVWRKGDNYVDFIVTRGPDNARELCAFDYIIIPY